MREQCINQDLIRYALHRARVVDAVIRDGSIRQLQRRTFYIDEYGRNIVAVGSLPTLSAKRDVKTCCQRAYSMLNVFFQVVKKINRIRLRLKCTNKHGDAE